MRLDIPNEIRMEVHHVISDMYDEANNVLIHCKPAFTKHADIGSYTKIPDGFCSCGRRKFKDCLIPYDTFKKNHIEYVKNIKMILDQFSQKKGRNGI